MPDPYGGSARFQSSGGKMRSSVMNRAAVIALAGASYLLAADPIFLRRQLSDVKPQPDDLTANAKAASYRPRFGVGDRDSDQLKTVARYGELTVGPNGTSALVSYPAEEQMYFVTEGSGTLLYGDEKAPVKKNDFMYLPVGAKHGMANSSNAPLKAIVMGYKIPDRKSTRLNSSHANISYAVFCLKKKKELHTVIQSHILYTLTTVTCT